MSNNFELLTFLVERFVLHDWWSSVSASTHCNLLVFYGYLLLLLLLYLYVVAINCLFELVRITSVQHSTELCTEVVLLTLRSQLISLLLAFFMSTLSCVETIQLICVANLTTGFYVELALAWKRLSTYLYYLVFINMLFLNRRFVMFLL